MNKQRVKYLFTTKVYECRPFWREAVISLQSYIRSRRSFFIDSSKPSEALVSGWVGGSWILPGESYETGEGNFPHRWKGQLITSLGVLSFWYLLYNKLNCHSGALLMMFIKEKTIFWNKNVTFDYIRSINNPTCVG